MDTDQQRLVNITKRMKVFGIIAAVLIILIVGFIFVKNNSFLTIQVPAESGKDVSYEVITSSGKTVQGKTTTGSVKVRVPSGNTQVMLYSDGKSYFKVVKTDGFFSTSDVTAQLFPEKKREFIGNNPGPCMNIVAAKLISYLCGDRFSNLNIHMPASSTTPTFVQKNPNKNFRGFTEGVITNRDSLYILVKEDGLGDSEQGHHLYTLSPSFEIRSKQAIGSLQPTKGYSLLPLGEGFVAFDSDQTEAFIFTSPSSTPERVVLEAPQQEGVNPKGLSVKSNSILSLYSSPDDTSKNANSVVKIFNGTGWQTFAVEGSFIHGVICGSQKFCLLGNSEMRVYEYSENEASYLYSIQRVSSIHTNGDQLWVIKDTGIINFDVDSASGGVDYSFGDYTFSGFQYAPEGFVLSVTRDTDKYALLINTAENNGDSIDKKIKQLQDFSDTENVSIYKQYVSIVPETGELVYSEAIGGYDYNQEKKRVAISNIQSEIDRIGISRSVYKIDIIGD